MRKSVIAALTFGVLLTIGAVRVNDMWAWRAQMIDAAQDRTGNLAFLLGEHLRETFNAGDAALRQLVLHSQRIGGPRAADSEWGPVLASARAGVTGLGSISTVDTAGVITHSTVPALVGQSRAGDYVFRTLTAPSADLVVGEPMLGISEPKQFIIPIGRRLTTRDGAFDGIVVATFLAATPRAFFSAVNVGRRGSV